MKITKKWLAVGIILILAMLLFVNTAVALSYVVRCQSLSGVDDENGANLTDNDVIQIVCTGGDGTIDPPYSGGEPSGDDWLVDTTYAGCNYKSSEPNSGKFDILSINTTDLTAGDLIYCRAWNDDTFAGATYYGDSSTWAIPGSEDKHDFGTWSTNQATGPLPPIPDLPAIILFGVGLLVVAGYFCLQRRRTE